MKKVLFFFVFTFVFLFFIAFLGKDIIPFSDILDKNSQNYIIFWQLRLPRTIFAFLIGGILSLAGLIFQSVFKNDLATPFTLGIASGASFGTMVAYQFNVIFSFFFITGQMIFAFLGASLSLFFILFLLKIKKQYAVSTVILAGVSVNFLFSAAVLFLQYIMNSSNLTQAVKWMMGGIDVFGYDAIAILSVVYFCFLLVAFYYRHHLDILSFGDEWALGRGVDAYKIRKTLFFVVSIVVAIVVSFSGPIGFVGLIVPHILKIVFGRKHTTLIFHSLFIGGIFLAVADFFARTVIYPAEMPVGIITSLLGIPFFLWLLFKKRDV